MNTPLLYHKVTPDIKKPLLASMIFIIGFVLFSLAVVLLYHYGIIVPKKQSIIAISSFMILFAIYILFTYDSYTGFKFPYFIQKYLIDPKLRSDLESHYPKTIQHAYILEIQASSASTHALLLQSPELAEPEWFYVNLNLMFPKLYFFHLIQIEQSCIGQAIDIEYLPESKVILKLYASELETDFSTIDGSPFFCAVPKSLNRIPSEFLLDFLNIQDIYAERVQDGDLSFNLLCKTKHKTYCIASSSKGFAQLELAFSTKINMKKYEQFKCDLQQQRTFISA